MHALHIAGFALLVYYDTIQGRLPVCLGQGFMLSKTKHAELQYCDGFKG